MATETERLQLLIDATSEGLRRELKRADDATSKFRQQSTQHFQAVDRSMAKVDDAAKLLTRGLGALGVAFSVGRLVSFTKETIASADALAKTADKLGLTIEGLQELRFGAARSGVEVGALENSIQRFTRGLGEAQMGAGTMLPVLRQYGIAMRDASGQARGAEAVLGDYANAVQGAGSAQERLRLTFAAFGREGGSLVNLLKNGSAGLDDLRQQARSAGVVLDAEFARKAEVLNDRLGVLDERSKVASTTLVFSLTPAIEGVLEVYERFSIGTSNLIAQFQEINTLGLGQLEARATSLRDKIKILEQTNASDWFGSLSTARQDLAAVETQITAIRDGVNTPPNATLTENLLGGTAGLTGANDNLMELTATLDGARKALDALAGGGSAAFEKVSKALDLNEQAAKLADSFNRSNKALIDSGQIQERTARAYLDVLTQTAEVQQQTTSTKALDEYVASLTDEYALAKVRLALGADEAKVQEALNQKRAEGVVISEDAEAVIRRTIAATSELNQRFAENEKAIAAAAKATEAAAAGRDSIPDEFADPFNHLILEALS